MRVKTLVIIPTYNEAENIRELLSQVLAVDQNLEVLVVDDNSPDKTSNVVRSIPEFDQRVHLVVREKKNGLGRAYIHGFKWALSKEYDWITQMDADFSHRPQDLSTMLKVRTLADVVVGSRWVSGGGTINWDWFRKLLSRGGSFYSRWILGYPLADWTGGFNMWKQEVLKALDLNTIYSEGYSFQIEMKYRAARLGFKIKEAPITFDERRAGQSKMSTKIVIEALYRVWSIRFSKI